MANKIISVFIEFFFPQTHLQVFLEKCSQLKFESKLTSRLQNKDNIFYPFYYRDFFVRDCIFELKERNSKKVANLFGNIISKWIIKKIMDSKNPQLKNFFITPIPQHFSKTREKGFCHTTTFSNSIISSIKNRYPELNVTLFTGIKKIKKNSKLHKSKNKRSRFNFIKNTMKSFITKQDAISSYFFIIDDVYTTGATFQEAGRGG